MAEEELLKKTNQVNLNMDAGEKEPTLEMKNIPGFDVLDSLPEEQKLKSYNDEFYTTLSNMKFLSLTIPPEDKLFYHFEKNNNASITSIAGQVYVTINELKQENQTLKNVIVDIQEKVNNLKGQIDNVEADAAGDIINEIKNLEKKLQDFVVETKTETFKLIKEVANLKKEKNELFNQIQLAFQRVEKLEKELGKNKRRMNKLNMNVNKQNVNNDKTFMETKSFNNTLASNKEKVQTETNL
jgi:chromosome segregation ATPase